MILMHTAKSEFSGIIFILLCLCQNSKRNINCSKNIGLSLWLGKGLKTVLNKKSFRETRHVIVFQNLPIGCARNRDFKTWESGLARVLLSFDNSEIFSWQMALYFYYCKLRHLLAKPSREFIPPSFCKLCIFTVFICILTLPRLKMLLVDTFCQVI